jgi:hypothetical protein
MPVPKVRTIPTPNMIQSRGTGATGTAQKKGWMG